ncbi:MAG: hypothetical protein J0M24_19000 [Verrucomicrobia bacterium]|nr:hypothetical protein [Verrucomicrobiota bacterium]
MKGLRILIVTPTLGASPWLSETVESVRAMCPDCVHVLVAPKTVVGNLAERFPHCVVLEDGGKEAGLYGAINIAVKHFTNQWDFMSYINDDDLLMLGFCDAVAALKKSDSTVDIAYGRVWYIDSKGDLVSPISIERHTDSLLDLASILVPGIVQQGMLVSYNCWHALNGFNERYKLAADFDFIIRAKLAELVFCFVDAEVAAFRLRKGQLSGALKSMEDECVLIRNSHFGGEPSKFRKNLILLRYRLGHSLDYFKRFAKLGFRSSKTLISTAD